MSADPVADPVPVVTDPVVAAVPVVTDPVVAAVPVVAAPDADIDVVNGFDIKTRKYIIHLFLGYSEEINNGSFFKKKIVNPKTGTFDSTIRKSDGVDCNKNYSENIDKILETITDTEKLTILKKHIKIIDCLIKNKQKKYHNYDEFKNWLIKNENQQMTFKDAMNSWNKYRIITVFEGGKIITLTEKIIFDLTIKITDIQKLNEDIETLKSLTENLKNQLGDIENYAGNNMYNTFIKTPTGKIFDLKKDIYSYILPVCLVNNDNIKDFKEKPSITDKLFSKDGDTSKKKELIDMLNKVVDKKTIQKFKFLFKNFLNKIKEEAVKEANSTTKAKAEAAVKAAEDDIVKEVKDLENLEAAKAQAETEFPKYEETFNKEIETHDLNLIHSIMKIYIDEEGTGEEEAAAAKEEAEAAAAKEEAEAAAAKEEV
jgi:hypothetical protein